LTYARRGFGIFNIGNPDGYQNKGVASWAKWMVVKTKEIGKLAQIGKSGELWIVGGGTAEQCCARAQDMLAHLLSSSPGRLEC